MEKITTLSYYWDLSSTDSEKRRIACLNLIENLQKFTTTTSITTEDDLKECPADVSYALKRLLRGLSSSRDGSRQGFSLALIELIKMININPTFLLDMLHEISLKNGTGTGQEEREFYFARIFGYQSMALSGILGNMEQSGLDLICDNLLKYSMKKDYLKMACCKVYYLVLDSISTNGTTLSSAINGLVEKYLTAMDGTLEKLWLLLMLSGYSAATLTLQDAIDGTDGTDVTAEEGMDVTDGTADNDAMDVTGDKEVAMDGTRDRVVSADDGKKREIPSLVLKELGAILSKKNKKLKTLITTTTLEGFHPVFGALVDAILSPTLIIKDKLSIFEFWEIFDQVFFNSTHERKFIAFNVFEKILPKLNEKEIPLIFTSNFMRCLINSLSSKEAYLNKQAKKTTLALTNLAKTNEKLSLPLVMQLLGKHGHFKFDSLTKTKTVENILAGLSCGGILEYLAYLEKVYDEQTDMHPWVLEQMHLLIKTGRIKKDQEWVNVVFDFIITHGFFDKSVGEEYQLMCKEKLVSALGHLSHLDVDGNSWVFIVFSKIKELEKGGILGVDETVVDETTRVHSKVLEIKKKISKESDKSIIKELEAFASLYHHVCILNYTDPNEPLDALSEISDCYKNIFSTNDSKKRKHDKEPEAVDVLCDLLVSFLAKPVVLLKNMALEVFKVFAEKCTGKVVDVIFEVLSAAGGVDGADELFEEEGEEDEEDGGDEEEESESDENDDEEGEDEELEELEGDVNEELRASIQEAMSKTVDQDMDDLNDDDMEIFDSKLAEIFGQRKALKKLKKETKENVLHFKLRVLDLLDIFLKAKLKDSIMIDTLQKLAVLFKDTVGKESVKVMHEKLRNIIKSRFGGKEFCVLSNPAAALQLLEDLHKMSSKALDQSTFNVYNQMIVYVVKSILHIPTKSEPLPKKVVKKAKKEVLKSESGLEGIVRIYKSSFTEYMTKKNTCLKPNMFTDIATRYGQVSVLLLGHFIEATRLEHKPRPYPMIKSFEILQVMFKTIPTEYADSHKTELGSLYASYSGLCSELFAAVKSKSLPLAQDKFKTILKSIQAVAKKCPDLSVFEAVKTSIEDLIDQGDVGKGVAALGKQVVKSLQVEQ